MKRIVSISPLNITEITNIEPFFELLLLADPSPSLVRDYTRAGRTFGAEINSKPVGVFVLLQIDAKVWELKNIAVDEACQGMGFGQQLLTYAIDTARSLGANSLEVGTASSGTRQIRFYESAGFKAHRLDEGFFTRNYSEPIIDDGVLCVDMIYLRQDL